MYGREATISTEIYLRREGLLDEERCPPTVAVIMRSFNPIMSLPKLQLSTFAGGPEKSIIYHPI